MTQEARNCQNCKKKFVIEPEDFEFYEKIKVPAPTFCPECRMQRRMVFRNERSLYKRKCNLCKADIISIYHKDSPYTVYCQKCWWSDKWESVEYGKNYDFSKSFFEQFKKLWLSVPQMALINENAVNSDYCHSTQENKNCYLVFGGDFNEDCFYSTFNFYCKDCLDLYWTFKSELSYGLVDCDNCYKVFFSRYANNCRDSAFLYDCHNCSDCFGCVGLRNKSYHIFNKPYLKEEYKKQIGKMNLGSFTNLSELKEKFNEIKLKYLHRYAMIIGSYNCTGDNIKNSRNCLSTFDAHNNLENINDLWLAFDGPKDIQSVCHISKNSELCYDSCSVVSGSNILFSKKIWSNNINIQCSYLIISSKDLFGCIGLRNKRYCILNKQYSKEEYEKLVPQIIEYMNKMPYIDKQGRIYKYGEFFPIELSPFAYNETIAQEYFPLTKEQAIKEGYSWKDPDERNIKIQIPNNKLPDHIKDVEDSIIGKTIECEHQGECNEQCTFGFKIIEKELEFYKKMNLPLPRLCPNCRHYQRIKQRNPLKLWHRKCQCAGENSENGVYKNTIEHQHGKEHCPNEFETTYSPDRKEIVYCEKCYQSEVV
ncbi:MAG: hypothetical protein V3T98_01985 [Candidatus Paceibacterota bacterium]